MSINGKELLRYFYQRYHRAGVNGLPKYHQLRHGLASAIAEGFWKPGEKMPAELDLARFTPFSLGTVQKALRALVEEGLVVRQQGRGTFVAEKRTPMDMPWSLRVISEEEGKFLPLYPKVLIRKRISNQPPWRNILNSYSRSLIQIDRLVDVGREFLSYSKFYLDGERFSGFMKKSRKELESTNFKNILRREFGAPITKMDYLLKILALPSDICKAIGVRRGTVGLIYGVIGYSGANPVYYQEIFIPPNKRRLFISDESSLPEGWLVPPRE